MGFGCNEVLAEKIALLGQTLPLDEYHLAGIKAKKDEVGLFAGQGIIDQASLVDLISPDGSL